MPPPGRALPKGLAHGGAQEGAPALEYISLVSCTCPHSWMCRLSEEESSWHSRRSNRAGLIRSGREALLHHPQALNANVLYP